MIPLQILSRYDLEDRIRIDPDDYLEELDGAA